MGLFSEKPPCPICGGKISWFLPSKIEDEYICDTCFNKIDMDDAQRNKLTMLDFKKYLAFYDENQLLKNTFTVFQSVDFGFFDTKIVFDYENKLFCMSKKLDKIIFHGNQLKSFIIKEDNTPLVEGTTTCITRHSSNIPERAMALSPQISKFIMNKQKARKLDRMDDGKQNISTPIHFFNIPEPFDNFNVEFHFNHPYWKVIKCDMEGPRFDNNNPDVGDYIRKYQDKKVEIEKLVDALANIAFSGVPISSVNTANTNTFNSSYSCMDAIEEIKKYKALMEDGTISSQEFDAKKKQLLRI